MLWEEAEVAGSTPSLHGQALNLSGPISGSLGWTCLSLPTMVERGAEVTDGKELESPEDVLCVARMTPLSPWGQGIYPDVERAQV